MYQVAEQANRSVHGFGIVSWEFQTASRAASLALIVTPFFLLDVTVEARQILMAATFAMLSLLPVWVAFRWIGRLYDLRAGLVAGLMMGTWLELLYFAPKASPDAIGGYLLLAAIFLGAPGATSRALVLSAACLAIAGAIRVQILPAVGFVLVAMALVHRAKGFLQLLTGFAAGVTLVGMLEWMWWGIPFLGHWNYVAVELTHGVSNFYGRQPLTFYIKNYVLMLGGAVGVVAFLLWAGARRSPILAVTALIVIAPFHLIGHKEYRFLLPAVPALVLLMTMSIADLIARLDPSARTAARYLVVTGWLLSMLAMGLGDFYRPLWTRDRNHVLAFRQIGAEADACGIALIGFRWWHTPGYSGLGRDIPIYEIRNDADAALLLPSANYVLVGHKLEAPPLPYVRWREYSRPVEYVYRRPGGCVPNDAARIVRPPSPVSLVE